MPPRVPRERMKYTVSLFRLPREDLYIIGMGIRQNSKSVAVETAAWK